MKDKINIFYYHASDSKSLEIIEKAFVRSFPNIQSNNIKIYLYISPSLQAFNEIKQQTKQDHKIIILGLLLPEIADFLGLKSMPMHFDAKKADASLDQTLPWNTSEYKLRYQEHILNQNVPYHIRYFARFDFTDEWNNHGYGKITADGSIWSVESMVKNQSAQSIVTIEDSDGYVGEFATVTDFDNGAVLYINRSVGTVDGLDWAIIENFLCRYRIDELVAVPLILDLPKGVKGIVSPRLDCDQSIINAQPIVDLYKEYGIDISLAISTGIPINQDDINFLKEFHSNGGSLVSHTITHHYSWGRDYSHAFEEAIGSKEWLEEHVAGLKVDYAVSPFHSNEPFAVQALADAGYKGFISGIIHNDPEYLVGVSGEVPFVTSKVVTHSQQCMLHGDCFHRYGNSVKPYLEAFEMHLKAGKMFGYLDHPFGGYHYGWDSQEERLEAHKAMIETIKKYDGIQWWTLTQLLDFVVRKSETILSIENDDLKIISKAPDVIVEYRGQLYV